MGGCESSPPPFPQSVLVAKDFLVPGDLMLHLVTRLITLGLPAYPEEETQQTPPFPVGNPVHKAPGAAAQTPTFLLRERRAQEQMCRKKVPGPYP